MGQNDRLTKLEKKIEEINKKNQMRIKEIN